MSQGNDSDSYTPVELSESLARLAGGNGNGTEVTSAAAEGAATPVGAGPSGGERRKKRAQKDAQAGLAVPKIRVSRELQTPSTMGAAEVDLFREKYHVPVQFWCRAAEAGETLVQVEEGWAALSTDLFEKGNFRLKLNPFFEEFLMSYGLPPSQVTPNSWKVLGAFMVLCEEIGAVPSLEILEVLFMLKKAPDGHYYLASKQNMKLFKVPSSIHPTRDKFFVCRPEDGWRIPTVWSTKKQPTLGLGSLEAGITFLTRAKVVAANYPDNQIPTDVYCTMARLKAAGVVIEGVCRAG